MIPEERQGNLPELEAILKGVEASPTTEKIINGIFIIFSPKNRMVNTHYLTSYILIRFPFLYFHFIPVILHA